MKPLEYPTEYKRAKENGELVRKRKKVEPKVNNAFAFFTTVIRHKMLEVLGTPLKGSGVFLEDLKTENQSVGDLF